MLGSGLLFPTIGYLLLVLFDHIFRQFMQAYTATFIIEVAVEENPITPYINTGFNDIYREARIYVMISSFISFYE
jgi:hypothetical protein